MISRIPQRNEGDCVICVLAMVMDRPYERVLADSEQEKYSKTDGDGKFLAWWEAYLRDEGFQCEYRPLHELPLLSRHAGRVLGLVTMELPPEPARRTGHIVAVDEFGAVDPADGAPDHLPIDEYMRNERVQQSVRFEDEWLI